MQDRAIPAPIAGVTGFVRKHRAFFIAGAVFVLCLLIFYVYWHLQVAEARGKSRNYFLNDSQDAATAAVDAEGSLEQAFYSEDDFHALGVVPVYTGSAAGSLRLTLYDNTGDEVAAADGNAAETLSGQWAVFHLADTLPAGSYTLVFTASPAEGAAPVALAKSAAAPAGWLLREGGDAAGGALCLMAATDRIGGFLTRYYWGFALLSAALLAAAVLLFCFRVALHKLYAVAAGGLCLLFCLVLPPYAAPDEQMHINQTFTISSWFLGQSEYKPDDGTTVRRASDQNALIEDRNTTVYTYRAFFDNLFTPAADSTPVTYQEEGVGDYGLIYWPTALVLTLCRLLGLGFVPSLLVGRLFNIAVFVALLTLAIKIVPTGKSIFAAVGMLPMTLHLAASFSRDCLTNGLYILYIALCLYYVLKKPRLDWPDLLLLALFILYISRAKTLYAPLLLLCLLIPRAKFHFRGKALGKWVVVAVKAALTLLIFSHLFSNVAQMLRMVWLEARAVVEGYSTYVIAAQVPLRLAPPLPEAGDVTFTVWDFFVRTGHLFWLLMNTLFTQFTFYVQSLVGGSLSYYSLELSWGFVIACLALLALALPPEPGTSLLRRVQRWFGLLACLAVTALMVGGFILWTPTGYDIIYGIQGRYFLPVLPLAMCCGSRNWLGLKKTRDTGPAVVLGFTGVGVFALLNAFLLVLAR